MKKDMPLPAKIRQLFFSPVKTAEGISKITPVLYSSTQVTHTDNNFADQHCHILETRLVMIK